MSNDKDIVSDRGFWISNQDWQHTFIDELAIEINSYISNNKIKSDTILVVARASIYKKYET